MPSVFTFLRRIAIRVSRSGGWMSVIRPHSNRDRSRSSSVEISRGGRSDEMTIWRAGLVERVERVEELLLDPLLVLEELDVVDEEHVVGAVALLEPLDALVAERVDEVVHERLARDVARGQPAGVLARVLRDRLQQVRLAEAGAAVDEQRVVRLRRRLGDRERGSVREAVRRADDEESKVYFGFIPVASPLRGGGSVEVVGRRRRWSAARARCRRRSARFAARARSRPEPQRRSGRGNDPRSTPA